VQRGERGPVVGHEPLALGQVPEQGAVADERQRVLALAPDELGNAVGLPVDDLDRLALLVGTFGVAGPARHHRG
jgi:hypothetical protein